MSPGHAPQAGTDHPFLTAPVGRLFLSNALPMIIVLSMSGLLNVVDGVFVGRFIGTAALAAVSATFPIVMLLTAMSALVGGGMSSLMARHLGAGKYTAAADDLRTAQALALATSVVLMTVFLLVGQPLAEALAGGATPVARMIHDYLRIIALAAPVQFMLGIQADALRNEGRARQVALLSIAVNLVNIAANFLLIVWCELGVEGSALGTAMSQVVGLALLIGVRKRDPRLLPLVAAPGGIDLVQWREILLLGLPVCLGLLGSAAASAMIILALSAAVDREVMLSAYGIVTRILGLAFLVQMAMALATQTIVGNNLGAGLHQRVTVALRAGMAGAALWCLLVVVTLLGIDVAVGAAFTSSVQVAAGVSRILHAVLVFHVFSGPLLVLALYFQASGRPGEAAMLTLVKPWLLTPALILIARAAWGTQALWYAFPMADAILLCAVLVVWLGRRSQRQSDDQPAGDAT